MKKIFFVLTATAFFVGCFPARQGQGAFNYSKAGVGYAGKIALKDATETETIIIPKYSRGECFEIDSSARMYVTFKQRGDQNHYLVFGGSSKKESQGLYTLFTLAGKDSVYYGGLKYKVVFGKGANILYNPEFIKGYNKVLIEQGVTPVRN